MFSRLHIKTIYLSHNLYNDSGILGVCLFGWKISHFTPSASDVPLVGRLWKMWDILQSMINFIAIFTPNKSPLLWTEVEIYYPFLKISQSYKWCLYLIANINELSFRIILNNNMASNPPSVSVTPPMARRVPQSSPPSTGSVPYHVRIGLNYNKK